MACGDACNYPSPATPLLITGAATPRQSPRYLLGSKQGANAYPCCKCVRSPPGISAVACIAIIIGCIFPGAGGGSCAKSESKSQTPATFPSCASHFPAGLHLRRCGAVLRPRHQAPHLRPRVGVSTSFCRGQALGPGTVPCTPRRVSAHSAARSRQALTETQRRAPRHLRRPRLRAVEPVRDPERPPLDDAYPRCSHVASEIQLDCSI